MATQPQVGRSKSYSDVRLWTAPMPTSPGNNSAVASSGSRSSLTCTYVTFGRTEREGVWKGKQMDANLPKVFGCDGMERPRDPLDRPPTR